MSNLDNSLRNLDLCQKAINLAVSNIDEGIDEDNEIISTDWLKIRTLIIKACLDYMVCCLDELNEEIKTLEKDSLI